MSETVWTLYSRRYFAVWWTYLNYKKIIFAKFWDWREKNLYFNHVKSALTLCRVFESTSFNFFSRPWFCPYPENTKIQNITGFLFKKKGNIVNDLSRSCFIAVHKLLFKFCLNNFICSFYFRVYEQSQVSNNSIAWVP